MRQLLLFSPSKPEMRRDDVARAWLRGVPRLSGPAEAHVVLQVLEEKLIACDHLEVSQALEALRRLVAWLLRSPEARVEGGILPADEVGAQVFTLYADTRPIIEWPGLGRLAGRWTLAFTEATVLSPAPELDTGTDD